MVGFNGGFLNLGTPEIIVIGAVAWAVLGPKELFKLAKQAGEFIGEWQQLGQQAKDQFTSALQSELEEDESKKAAAPPPPPEWAAPMAEPAASTMASSPVAPAAAAGSSSSSIPSLADYAAAREASDERAEGLTADEQAALRDSMYETLGEPGVNAANFAEQMSGTRNANVLSEYPAELGADDGVEEGSALDVQSADELLLQNQIEETENELQMLQAEKRVLALKRQQLEQNSQRARRMADERALAELSTAESGEGGASVNDVASAEPPRAS